MSLPNTIPSPNADIQLLEELVILLNLTQHFNTIQLDGRERSVPIVSVYIAGCPCLTAEVYEVGVRYSKEISSFQVSFLRDPRRVYNPPLL